MPTKRILLPCPSYLRKFAEAEMPARNGWIELPPFLIHSKNRMFYRRYLMIKKAAGESTLKVECTYAGTEVRYLAAMEYYLRTLFYTHLWTSIRVAQRFQYPAMRAIHDFLAQYQISPDEMEPASLFRKWQRVKTRKNAKKSLMNRIG